MQKNYRFVRVEKISPEKDDNYVWYFVPQSLEQVKEHWKKYPASIIREGSSKIASKVFNGNSITDHICNDFEEAVIKLNSITNSNIMSDMVQVENVAYNQRINDFVSGRKLFLSHGLTVVTLDTRFYHITEEIYKDVLTFPDEDKPTMADVRYIQWGGGEHWYAKIGKLDVVDENGNQKWNTKAEAKQAAEWYVKNNW